MSILKTIIAILAIAVAGLAITVFTGVLRDKTIESTNSALEQGSTLAKKITIQEKYSDGKFTIFGAIQTPTPCHSISLTSSKVEEDTYMVSIMTKESTDPCAQVITDQTFEYSFAAPEDTKIVGSLDGEVVEFNRIRIPEGEDFVNPIEYTKG